ncbi:MAG: polyribonucleotide nucleotidyltransferase [Chloroflexi bacterium]|nr:polyribonucleotide nucleotidyltransferase [Chloroflexota bacterium]
MSQLFEREIAGRLLSLEAGKVAEQADGAVTVRYGDSLVLVTACASLQPREGVDFLPLTIDYEERLYAAGKIPGSWFRREGRPSSAAILTARLTDRPLRPLFPKNFRRDIQIIITVLSADQENDPDILSIVGASAALSMSDIPFAGPVSATRIGYLNGEFIVNPTFAQLKDSQLDLVVAGGRDAVVMVEAGASEVPEEVVLEAIRRGQEVNAAIIALQDEIVAAVGKPKQEWPPLEIAEDARKAVIEFAGSRQWDFLSGARDERDEAMAQRRKELIEALGETYPPEQLAAAMDDVIRTTVRSSVLEGRRPDGRHPEEIRPISCEVGLLPRTHGSALFTRGQTQALTIVTLGSLGERQELDNIEPEETKRFIHHYNFPPFSVGEARPLRGPSRRDVGHGALAERALLPVIPSEEDFPYTIRLVSEVLSSNGSTSMASVCGSALSLMDAGVPIKAPVAGIAMGLVKGEDDKFSVLTDIAGLEDAFGDMDFKVAGTSEGITALQMDIKTKGISYEVMEQALGQAREARLFILRAMLETIPEVRPEMSPYAPKMIRLQIPQDKIGTVIGPGGRMIRSIIEETKCTIDVEDDGIVLVGSPNEEAARRAVEIIESLTKEVEVGEIYTGTVTRLVTFGAFVEILPGKEGLVRVEELAEYRVRRPEDVVRVGDEIMVMVNEIDNFGRINLSRRAVLEGTEPRPAEPAGAGAPVDRPGGGGGPDRGGAGGRGPGGRGPGGGGGGRRDFERRPPFGDRRRGNGRPRQGGGGGRPPQQGGQQRGGPSFRRAPGEPPPPPPRPPMKRW